MKILKNLVLIFSLLFSVILTNGQDVELGSGDIQKLKGEKTINIEFTYNKLGVGDYAREKDYVKHKVDEYNAKEPGSGDKWALEWVADRKGRYEPKFIELFTKYAELTFDTTAKYTLIFNTTFIEPGYQIGISKKPGEIEGTALFVETANRTKKVASISVDRGGSAMFKGAAFDAATRIGEAYASAAKKMGTLVKKEVNKK